MGSDANNARRKILLVDDDQDFLEVYWEILKAMPGSPEVHTASTGGRALALLESEPFNVMIVDLNMPKMDGLQVIAIARRKYPRLKVVVWTCIVDEQYRARAYAMGVDQYWQKPASEEDRKNLLDSVQMLLQDQSQNGFRGLQSKSLVDLIQLECLSQNSTQLRITNGPLVGKIWINGGELIDAETLDLKGEAGFRAILDWKAGTFEILPGEPERERTIFSSYHALLLEVAQALDEAASNPNGAPQDGSPLLALTRFDGVQWVLSVGAAPNFEVHSWGVESPDHVSEWAAQSLRSFTEMGERLNAGLLQQVTAMSATSNVAFAGSVRGKLCVGFRNTLRSDQVRESMRNILAKWAS